MAITARRVEHGDLEQLRAKQARPELNLVDQHFEAQAAGTLVFAAAFEDGVPLGTAVLDLASEDLAPELRNMFVYPAGRRRGAGRALSTFLEDEARAAGYAAVYLAVDPDNAKAVPLYISLEYHPTGEHLFVDENAVRHVEASEQADTHFAVYKKSLTAR